MIDALLGGGLLASLAAGGLAWLVVARNVRYERISRAAPGLLGHKTQTAAYWLVQPLGRALARSGISANAITLASLPFAVGAGVAFAEGYFGVGAWLAVFSFACDALDGLVARATNTASDSGEVLDATVDRVCEALLFAGITVAWRESIPLVLLTAAAGLGAQQVTLATAKSEVFPRVRVPKGSMRRAERAAALVLGAALSGACRSATPLIVALSLIAIVANASALHRFRALGKGLRREPERAEDEVPHAAE